MKNAAMWKYDKYLGIAFFCPQCRKFVCSSGKCKCGCDIDLDLAKIEFTKEKTK